ncbi:rhodanese-like domain-containing protein [Lactobacillus corticis]|uniref:Rhodanese-like domain protein n=1 Tax=Lactobacillus corticis TaxID=2201249 RepID=A0A916VHZ0_9LACO|nr:rhodanese-like domain-containing protein [Lactobacillus corticis]GFZ26700.1 rhodanese-like domain protein [Lactobacillus corticis]
MSSFLIIVDVILIIIIAAMVIYWLYTKIMAKSVGGELDNEGFKEGMRKAQIVDLREEAPFKRKHIDGARSFPYQTLRYKYQELRPDLPVYLYSDSLTITLRAARFLKKKGYGHLFYLKDGFENWDGRTKKAKY